MISKQNPKAAITRNLYSRVKANAKEKNIRFQLTKEEFYTLCISDCHYCGIAPFSLCFPTVKVGGRKGKYAYNLQRGLHYNGIDRVDNSIGYEISNCVPCCKHCNYAKRNRSVKDFLEWVKMVYLKNSKEGV